MNNEDTVITFTIMAPETGKVYMWECLTMDDAGSLEVELMAKNIRYQRHPVL